jgi:hypothetical protein
MNCSAKPVLTEDLCIVQKEEFSITCYMCDMYTWWTAKHIHKRQSQLLVTEDVTYGLLPQGLNWKKKNLWWWVSWGLTPRRTDWRQTASREVTVTLTLTSSQKERDVPFVNNVTYLGVTSDRWMTWRRLSEALRTYVRTYSLFRSWRLSTY